MPEKNENKANQLELAVAHLDRQFGKGSVFRLGDENINPWPSISTGAFTLDLALGIGGLPKGRIVEVFGPESSGKTTVCLNIIAEAQRHGGICAFIDAEHSLDPRYARALGVNINDLWISQPDYGEQALEIVDALVKTEAISVVVVDSVAALIPKRELEGDMGDSHMGRQPALMSQAMRKLVGPVHNTNTLVLFTNQLREKVGLVFGNPETQPGGRALKFYASVRIDLRRVEDIKEKDSGLVKGVRTKAKVIKNKMAPPLRIAEFDIIYGKGVDTVGCIFDAALDAGLVTKNGAWFYYEGEALGQGRSKSIELLATNEVELETIKEKIQANATASLL